MLKAVIFDLDGVIVSTDKYHFKAWSQLCKEYGVQAENSVFDQLRGVSRGESLKLIMGDQYGRLTEQEKDTMLERKNNLYLALLKQLNPGDILPGILELLFDLKAESIALAIGSSSKNAAFILEKLSITSMFDVIVSGIDITHSKPHPEIFTLAAARLQIDPANCVVVEDAEAGLESAKRAGMAAVGVGSHLCSFKPQRLVQSTEELTLDLLKSLID